MSTITALKTALHLYGGPAKANRYQIELPPRFRPIDREINDRGTNGIEEPWTTPDNMDLFCRAVNLPGRQLLSQERTIMGNQEKIAYGYASEDVTLTFIDRDDHPIRKYFTLWQEQAFDLSDEKAAYHKPNFANEYTRSVKIYQLGHNNEKTYGIELQHAYPTTLGAVSLSASSESTLVEYTVELSYKKWFLIVPN